jgi:hypothetical protein
MPQGFFFLIWFVINNNKLLAELLGFYYDKEKNRYSPLKGSILGSSSSTNNAQEPSTANTQVSVSCVCVCVAWWLQLLSPILKHVYNSAA